MRVGINIPDELYERFKPLRGTYNLSQICRDAIKSRIESYENAQEQAQEDGMQALANRFLQDYVKKTILDWEAIGRENARKWAEDATLEDFEDLFHNISVRKKSGNEPGEFLGGWRIKPENRYEAISGQHDDWFDRMYDLDPETNYYAIAKQDYNQGWISYLTAVWQMLQDKIKSDEEARVKARQQNMPNTELPSKLKDNKEDKI